MRPRTWALMGVLAVLAGLLVLLGTLQVRWLDQVAQTLTAQKRAALFRRGSALAEDLERELTRLYYWFQLDDVSGPEGNAGTDARQARQQLLARRWASWGQSGRQLGLVADLYLYEGTSFGESARLSRLDPATAALAEATWPPDFGELAARLAEGPPPMGLITTSDASAGPVLAVPPDLRLGPPGRRRVMVLIRLDLGHLRGSLLPRLATERLGSGQDDDDIGEAAAMELRDASGAVLFRWPAEAGTTVRGDEHPPLQLTGVRPTLATPALLTGLDPPPRERPRGGGGFPSGLGGPWPGPRFARLPGPPELQGTPGPPPRGPGPWPRPPAAWSISLGYVAGPVDALVTSLRRRNIALGLSILGLLGGALAALTIAVRRAHGLAERQRRFMASVSHELRTPLTVIGSAAENLRDGTVDGGERVREYGELIHAESKRLTAMMDDVLRLAAGKDIRQSLRLERLDARDVVEAAIDSFQPELKACGGSLERSDPDEPALVMADAEALRQAVENVVGNALKYGGEPPAVVVRLHRVDTSAGPEVRIAVEDRGLGIPADEVRHVFEPFFRGREPMSRQIRGTGLGLSLVSRVMKAHGGGVSVESTPGHGSRFVLRLPLVTGQSSPGEGSTSP